MFLLCDCLWIPCVVIQLRFVSLTFFKCSSMAVATLLSYDSVVCFCWKYPTHNILLPFYSFFLDIRAKVKIQKQKQCCEITQRNSEPCRTRNTAPLPSIEDRGQTVRITTSTRAGLHRCRSTPHAAPRLLTMETYYCGQRSIAIGRRSRYSWNDHNLAMTCDLDL